ncbi:PilZ domain-containing protein [Marinobacter fonticola]|uniref:PilZ domain-containing protein n=1 Tax=Marinobacter fonticola TaxID=2603215 RepID=UPI0011E6DA2D|nr:PilZ domain-containing protein [Marinobacter fonticola]
MRERRRRERLPFIQMDARVKVGRGFFSNHWTEVQVNDFSKLGMAIVSDHEFKEGEKLQFSLRLNTEVGDITVERAEALVRNSRVGDDGTIYGLEFPGNQKTSIGESLGRIESVLTRYKAVSERIRS